MCCHCIPVVPTDADSLCNVCNVAQWDDADPVEQGSVIQHGCTLVSLGSDQKVSVYHRKCSDRQDPVAISVADLSVSSSGGCLMLLVQVLQRTVVLSG